MIKSLFFSLITIFSANLYASNFDLMLPCHGCSDWKMKQVAQNAASQPGQTIYVVDNRNGQFYVNEYYVDHVDPGSMSIANEWLREVTRHVPGSSMSNDLAASDTRITTITNDITRPFTINSTTYNSAFIVTDSSDFAEWFTNHHYSKNLENFNMLDAELASAASSVSIGLSIDIFSIGVAFNSTPVLTYQFPDGTKVQMAFNVLRDVTTGKYQLLFKDPIFKDSKGLIIPKTKLSLKDYINNSQNLEENGDNEAIKEHINYVFEGNVQYIGFGEGNTGGGRVEILDCGIELRNNVEVVACYRG
ncbi:hypothetical protein SG34_027100 [Thalassomonas viridans]|uniref:Uncharacterized protein n=1 Tax=Thalassomonas viridans TaxID=137584 RepID=A0AAE9Z1I9_9GAMM|nr:hypothetical protein [Thalassomonas viridans]WDE04930.1 hypothetical protein SG34_027100 [Thalassomonas viridans]